MTASSIAIEGPPPDRRIGEMNPEDAMEDISLLLIAKKAGYGLAPPKWRATLEQIRCLPQVQVRRAS
jgi:uncharacterized protein YjeT (DUF2065 family)